jgi:hypothetical protein
MIQPGLRKLEYAGTLGVMGRAIDVYESPLGEIKLFDGIYKVTCTQSDLEWLVSIMAESVYGWKEKRLVEIWI